MTFIYYRYAENLIDKCSCITYWNVNLTWAYLNMFSLRTPERLDTLMNTHWNQSLLNLTHLHTVLFHRPFPTTTLFLTPFLRRLISKRHSNIYYCLFFFFLANYVLHAPRFNSVHSFVALFVLWTWFTPFNCVLIVRSRLGLSGVQYCEINRYINT